MAECPSCSRALLDEDRPCPVCGALPRATPTTTAFPDPSTRSSGHRFVSGAILASRYRIVSLVGRGGMGEVYRADDLRLGQPVALKFLPEKLAARVKVLERFHDEVRLARQITHPNVCRVHDIGDAEGRHFLSMEFVDGEDLASLLRRIGRLPGDKGVEIARQLCAGLAAAHEKGVLHRDLKPANVMLDGRGRVRVMDFGLAAVAEDIAEAEITGGTPAYMAPEQLAGSEVSARSDIYALGLVLYEIFTGRHAFEAKATPAEMLRQRETSTPVSLGSIVPGGLDEAVERVVLRCLEKDPRRRPASAMAVAAALPGGDPLAAALAAGETPSPELVAAAGEDGGLRSAVAWSLLAAVLAGSLLVSVITARRSLFERVPLDKSPEVLADRAVEIVHRLGYTDPPADSTFSIDFESPYLAWVERNDSSGHRWDALSTGRPTVVTFTYRQSPQGLMPSISSGRVTLVDPPNVISGMVSTMLDTRGRLDLFVAIPPAVDEPKAPVAGEPDWAVAFEEAGLDISRFSPVAPTWLPYAYADSRAAWEGNLPELPDTPISIQAAAYRGRLVYFEVVGPWSRDWRMIEFNEPPPTATEKATRVGSIVLLLMLLVGAGLLTWRNLRLERADRKGALRIAAFVFGSGILAFGLGSHHVASFVELGIVFTKLGTILIVTGMTWMLYTALEPIVRRRWPESLISWSRLLAGRIRDPAIGRDLLIGACVAISLKLIAQLEQYALSMLGQPPSAPFMVYPGGLLGLRYLVADLFFMLQGATLVSMMFLLALLVLRILLRRQWLAVTIFLILFAVLGNHGDRNPVVALAGLSLAGALVLVTLVRFGLLAMVAAFFFNSLISFYPVSTGLAHWHSRVFLFNTFVLCALAVYAFFIALAGRSPFGRGLLQE